MAWIPIAAWIAAAVIAVVVLGFCAYEINWKTRRLRADLGELNSANEQLGTLRTQLGETQRRLAASRSD